MDVKFLGKWKKWRDDPRNPLIKPRPPDWIIADPTFITSEESPDGLWHLFAHSIITGINHFKSKDGITWQNSFDKNKTSSLIESLTFIPSLSYK